MLRHLTPLTCTEDAAEIKYTHDVQLVCCRLETAWIPRNSTSLSLREASASQITSFVPHLKYKYPQISRGVGYLLLIDASFSNPIYSSHGLAARGRYSHGIPIPRHR